MIVIADASAVATFLLPDEGGRFADFARATCASSQVHVPEHWQAEMANVIWKARRRKRIGDADIARIAAAASALAETVTIMPEVAITDLVAAASRFGLTTYDASYLLLAHGLHVPLLTRDERLAEVAAAEQVEVLRP